ncbi:MAG: CPBP family intramembrane glutamic endopeptidase [Planctomycetota bacterium]|jgi:membrane protease YdiL (CAAX protease family)
MALWDHLVALVVAVVLPALSSRPDDDLRRTMVESVTVRRAIYLQTMGVQWLFAWVCLWRVGANGAAAADIGLSPLGKEPGLLVAWVLGGVVVAWRVLRGRWVLASRERRREVLFEAVEAAPFLPQGRADSGGWVLLSFTAGLCEEIIYRGFLITYGLVLAGREFAVPRIDDAAAWAAVVGTSVAFAAAHLYQGRRQATKVVLAGLLFGTLYVIGGSLWPCILVHAFVDVHEGWLARAIMALEPDVMSTANEEPTDAA